MTPVASLSAALNFRELAVVMPFQRQEVAEYLMMPRNAEAFEAIGPERRIDGVVVCLGIVEAEHRGFVGCDTYHLAVPTGAHVSIGCDGFLDISEQVEVIALQGIIKSGGVIGGVDQRGNYLMDCRFNREDLARRVERIAKYGGRIHLTRLDAADFIGRAHEVVPERALFCIDPPYFKQGSSLYTSYYRPEDHAQIASHIRSLQRPWIVTYDDVPEIREL